MNYIELLSWARKGLAAEKSRLLDFYELHYGEKKEF